MESVLSSLRLNSVFAKVNAPKQHQGSHRSTADRYSHTHAPIPLGTWDCWCIKWSFKLMVSCSSHFEGFKSQKDLSSNQRNFKKPPVTKAWTCTIAREIPLTTEIFNAKVCSFPQEFSHVSGTELIKHPLWGQP